MFDFLKKKKEEDAPIEVAPPQESEQPKMPQINGVEFGMLIIEGKRYGNDIVILPNGKIASRDKSICSSFYGTDHVICTEEVRFLLDKKPKALVIGTGAYGACRIEEGVKREAEKQGVKLFIDKTMRATKIYNNLPGEKAAIFHVTC